MKTILISLTGTAMSMALIAGVGLAKIPSRASNHQTESQTKTFVGEITRQPTDRAPVPYILQTGESDYFLDSNRKVEKYNEKKVEITGALDQANDTIHVESIREVN
jgi:hypothetical protein